MSIISTLKDLVKINTVADQDHRTFITYVENYLKPLGFKTEHNSKNLIMTFGSSPKLGFLGHADTVRPSPNWKTDPHKLTQIGDKLYGLGTCDMKSGIACLLETLSQINLQQLTSGIKVYITYGEETTFGGIKDLVSSRENFPPLMLIAEPTNNQYITGNKGLFEVEITATGVKVHASTPHKGKSAISAMIKLLSELQQFYDTTIKPDHQNIYEIPYTTMNIDLINGGDNINSVAGSCTSFVDFRIAKSSHITIIKRQLVKLCKQHSATYTIHEQVPPFSNIVPFADETSTANYITEASLIPKSQKIILGPGPITAHEANEYISAKSLQKTISQYKKIILTTCS